MRGRRQSVARPSLHGAASLAGVFFAADLGAWHWSITYTTVANSTLLANFAPILVALGGWLLFRSHVPGLFVFAMITALTGATLLVGSGFALGGTHVVGDTLGLLTAVSRGNGQYAVGNSDWCRVP